MIYLLGGPPRVGKSVLSRTITKKHGINVVSTDSLGAVLENVLDPELEPGLFIVNKFNGMSVEDRMNLMVEGVAVLPELVSQLRNVAYRAVFVGNQGNDHKENIKKSAKENDHDWMQDASDEYIEAFAMFVAEMSRYIEKEARNYSFDYIEMGNKTFNDAVDQVVGSLLKR